MTLTFALALVFAPISATPRPVSAPVVTAQPRAPLAVAFLKSLRSPIDAKTTQGWMRSFEATVQDTTRFYPVRLGAIEGTSARFQTCVQSAAFACWVRLTDVLAGRFPKKLPQPRLLMLLYQEGAAHSPELHAVLLDMNVAQELVRKKKNLTPEELEDLLLDEAVLAQLPHYVSVSSFGGIESLWTKMMNVDFGPVWTQLRATPFGKIAIDVEQNDVDVHLDTRSIGRTQQGKMQIVNLSPGQYRIDLTAPGCQPSIQIVHVLGGKTTQVSMPNIMCTQALVSPQASPGDIDDFWLWVGIAAGVVAVGVTTGVVIAETSSPPNYELVFDSLR